MLRQWDIP
jgi:hypothetical protein